MVDFWQQNFLKIFLTFAYCTVPLCVAIDGNFIVGTPNIDCQSQRIKIAIKTEKPFGGRIYLKGNSHRKECVTDFTEESYVGPRNDSSLAVAVDYNLCNTERIRTLSPNGVTYANTLVVQFHRIFITTGDKAYHIRCFYSEIDKTVTQRFDVSNYWADLHDLGANRLVDIDLAGVAEVLSQMTTDELVTDMEMPTCSYTVRRESVNGPIVRTAQVGDIVYHKWECNGNTDAYGMLVHSCYVESNNGERDEILDENGCTRDAEILPLLEYNQILTLAYARAKVFRYPDNSFIHFRCQIKLCTKIDGSCDGFSPPDCQRRRSKRSKSLELGRLGPSENSERKSMRNRRSKSTRSGQKSRAKKTGLAAGLDVITREILVFDEDELLEEPSGRYYAGSDMTQSYVSQSLLDEEDSKRKSSVLNQKTAIQICANRLVLICIMAGFFLFFASAIGFIIFLMVKNREKTVDGSSDIYGSTESPGYLHNTVSTDIHNF